jgi:hypothetical protein
MQRMFPTDEAKALLDLFRISRVVRVQSMESAMSKRELIDTGNDKRFVRRDDKGRFKESDDVGRSLAADQRRHSDRQPPRGEGDRGDRQKKH